MALRIAAGVAVAALVLGAFAYVMQPRVDDSAFARQAAADAMLIPADGSILHYVVVYSDTGWTQQFGHDARYDINQTWENWLDPEGLRSRGVSHNNGDGSLDGISVRVGKRYIEYGNNVRYGTGTKPTLTEWPASGPLTSMMGAWLDEIRPDIESGKAKVTGTKVVDGDECWVVSEYSPAEDGSKHGETATVVMRQSDYRIKSLERYGTFKNGNGEGWGRSTFTFKTWETLPSSSLPADFFSLDAAINAAPKGTKIDVRTE
jgi:hypothetical protein